MFDEPIWGLDFGSTAVRVVRLARRGLGFEIVAVDRIDTYRDPTASTAEEMDAALRKALSIFAVNHRIGARDRVGVALPGLGFETALIDLPPVARGRVDNLVEYEVRARAGAAASEVAFAYRELPSMSVNERRVLVASGSIGILGGYLDILRSAGISPDRVTLAPLAFTDALRADGVETHDTMAARIGVGVTDIVVGLRGGPIVRTEPEGTLWMRRALQDRLGLGAQEAEAERRAIENGSPDPRVRSVVTDFARRIADRFESVRDLARARNPNFSPTRLLIAGEGGRIDAVVTELQNRLKLPVEVHRKWNRVAIAKPLFAHALAVEIPTLAVAVGAALDAAGASSTALSFVPVNRRRESARALPLVAACSLALASGVFAGERIVSQAEQSIEESANVVAESQFLLGARMDLERLRLQETNRRSEAERILTLPAEWSAWDRALTQGLETLAGDTAVLSARWVRRDSGIELQAIIAVPRLADEARNHPAQAASFQDSVELPLIKAGFTRVRLQRHRAVEVATVVPQEAAGVPRFEWFEFSALAPTASEPTGEGER
ncbi:MAG: pilus assembly protein PilM [Planctomycetes bacterium]|nr:pilus assembly protein PilM [Planctomycetota bacterium]